MVVPVEVFHGGEFELVKTSPGSAHERMPVTIATAQAVTKISGS